MSPIDMLAFFLNAFLATLGVFFVLEGLLSIWRAQAAYRHSALNRLRSRFWDLARPVLNRFIPNDTAAWELGFYAYHWRLVGRILFVRHEHQSRHEGGLGENGLGPWRVYILTGNRSTQFSEFIDGAHG